jgi:hypothetical protein
LVPANVQKQIEVEIERMCREAFLNKGSCITLGMIKSELKGIFGESLVESKMSLVNKLLTAYISKVYDNPSPDASQQNPPQVSTDFSRRSTITNRDQDRSSGSFFSSRGAAAGAVPSQNSTNESRLSTMVAINPFDKSESDDLPNVIRSFSTELPRGASSSARELGSGIFEDSFYPGRRNKKRRKRSVRSEDESDDDDDEHAAAEAFTGDNGLDDDIGLSHTDVQEQTFMPYSPTTCSHPCLFAHPDELVETSSLSSVSDPKVANRLRLPSKTLLDGLLTRAQAEVCLRSISQHELRLPNGHRCGFFMGDGAGVGKGGQQAAIILHHFLHGRRKALWFSISADLIEDAKRDISYIGAAKLLTCHSLKSHRIGSSLHIESGILFCTY